MILDGFRRFLVVALLSVTGSATLQAQDEFLSSLRASLEPQTPEVDLAVGVVNLSRVEATYSSAVEMRERARVIQRQIERRIQQDLNTWNRDLDELVAEVPLLSDQDVSDRYTSMAIRRDGIEARISKLKEVLLNLDTAIMAQIRQDLRGIWPELVQRSQSDFVLTSEAVMAWDESVDLTDMAVEELENLPYWPEEDFLSPLRRLSLHQ
jgi:Skp family chaperone for outer membrane proteins